MIKRGFDIYDYNKEEFLFKQRPAPTQALVFCHFPHKSIFKVDYKSTYSVQ